MINIMYVFIVPYRDRVAHLNRYLETLSKYLKDREYSILVIEQANKSPFNAGMIRNIGFKEACKKFPNQDYFIFNDVDIVPILLPNINHEVIDFGHPGEKINHLYGMKHCIGGVYSISKHNFIKINGYPTGYWGWGFEDTDLLHYRVIEKNIDRIGPLYLRNQEISLFSDISKHHRDMNHRSYNKKLFNSRESPGGLDSMEYQVISESFDPALMYYHIKVDFEYSKNQT